MHVNVIQKIKGKVPGFSVKTVDTTGAGDAFVGSFLVSMAKDMSIFEDETKLKEALSFANACGAICTTQKGAIPVLPTQSAALELISKSKSKKMFSFPLWFSITLALFIIWWLSVNYHIFG
ncbi:unnamed protein product [Prunus armeniaca]|uniref:Carbohydrate kinase PfkB domain-containing protein n=1 Tax=Prunus armeniaca TaxID=36596 RepID=A0A6J5VJ37_PRUAR|nr:unnamed protein product [Prunus armeniaca]